MVINNNILVYCLLCSDSEPFGRFPNTLRLWSFPWNFVTHQCILFDKFLHHCWKYSQDDFEVEKVDGVSGQQGIDLWEINTLKKLQITSTLEPVFSNLPE